MSRYTPDSTDRVRDAIDMVALIESKVELRRTGVNSYFGCCPFHDERTASFHVRPDEKHYHCFGCSESGDPFTFVMATEGLDFKGALESLAGRFGVTLETVDEDPAAAARRARRERLYSLLTRTASFYERMLWESREGEPARDYLVRERGLEPDVLRTFRVGWAPEAWDRVLIGSRSAGFSDEEMLVAGLIQRSRQDTQRVYDRFRAQIMFPTADARGRVIGFGGRKMPGDSREWLPKYINTAELEGGVYSKRAVLYGVNEARGPAAKRGRMVLAEGYTDVIALHQAGVVNAVGIMGTSLTKEQVSELGRLVGTLELCLDADGAGQAAMARAAQLCAETDLALRVVALPPGADPGELIKAAGAEALRDQVKTSVPYVVFAVERILDRADLSSSEGKDDAIRELAPALRGVAESVLLDDLRRRIAGALGIADSRLMTLLAGAGAGAGAGSGSGGGHVGPPPSRDAPAVRLSPPSAPGRRAPSLSDGAEFGVKTERDYLAMCLSAGEAGQTELARIDPDALLTSAVLRRVVRRLAGQLELGAGGVTPAPEDHAVGDDNHAGGDDVSDAEVSIAIDDLESRADRAAKAQRTVGADELEHARLLLEMARVNRQIHQARLVGEGVPNLGTQRRMIQEALRALGTKMDRQQL